MVFDKKEYARIKDFIKDCFPKMDDWFYVRHPYISSDPCHNGWDKYLIFSKDQNKLLDILYWEVFSCEFAQGKVSKTKLKGRYALCLYSVDDSSTEMLTTKYGDKDVFVKGFKHYSKEEIKKIEELK